MGSVSLIDPLEDPRWDRFVERHPLGWITHLSGWKRVLEGSFSRMKGYYLAISNGNGGEIEAALPLFEVTGWLREKTLVSVPFGTLCDPLVSNAREMDILLDAARGLSEQSGARTLEIRAFGDPAPILDSRVSRHAFLKNHSLRVDASPEELFKKFHRTCVRQRITRAEKAGLRIRRGSEERDVDLFYRMYRETRKRLGFPPQPKSLFQLLWREFAPAGRIAILFAEREGQPLSVVILLKFKDRMSAEYLAWDFRCRDISPNHFLFWEAIKWASSEGFEYFDFGATSPNNTTLMEFKGHWGTTVADIVTYFYPRRAWDGWEEKERSLAYRLTRRVCRRMPSPVLEILGDCLYRQCW